MIKRPSWILGFPIIAAVLFLTVPSCSKKAANSGWKAEVSVVDGVKTIRNPETPRYGTFAFDLAEDLAIGKEDESYLFSEFLLIVVDDEGTIYACDFALGQVRAYDTKGVFVRALGRKGQGPGEYSSPGGLLIDEVGNLYVRDSRSLVAYDKSGLFLREIQLKRLLGPDVISLKGSIIGTISPNSRTPGGPKNQLVQLDADGEYLRPLAEFPAYGVSNGGVLKHWYSGRLLLCRRTDNSAFFGFSLDYKIYAVDGRGQVLFAFSKPEDVIAITRAEEDKTRQDGIFSWSGIDPKKAADLGMPDHRPFFSRLLSDDAGRLYVVHFLPITEKDNPSSDVDVFSKDGSYLYRMTWPFPPQVIKGGFFYEVRQGDEAGLTKIVRHRIKNWGDFRTE